MPANIVKSFAEKTDKSIEEVEILWKKAKEIANKNGEGDNYEFITGILKKMLKLNETDSFKEFLTQAKIEKLKNFE